MDIRISGRWESFDDIDGLGHECECLSEDSYGNIWIGTNSGLTRYDGRDFENLMFMDGLENVRNIYVDKESNLWIATNNGLVQYDGKKVINFSKSDGLIDNDVHCIHQGDDGNLWIGTGNGLSRYDGSEFVNFNKNDGLAGNYIHCIYQHLDGSIWIGTSGDGISCYDGSKFTNLNTEQGLVHNIVLDIIHSDNGDIWIGTYGGLSRYDGKIFSNYTVKDGLAGNYICSLYKDRDGNIWIGTLGTGISCYDGSRFINFNTEHGLAHNAVMDIIQDREGSLWFACYHGGISRYNPYEVSSISNEAVDEVMMKDKRGKLWWGFRNVLSSFDGKHVNHYQFDNNIFDLLEDSKGQFWVGTDGGGIFKFQKTEYAYLKKNSPKTINLTSQDGLTNNRVVRIREDKNGNIWIGTRNGLSCYDDRQFRNFTTKDGLASVVVSNICEDKNGNLWFAGWGGDGIAKYDGKDFYRYTKKDGLVNNSVICMIEDSQNNLWIGTSAGLSCYNGKSFNNYRTEDGLSGDFVQRMIQDTKGQIWIATLGGGISRFDGKNFQSLTKQDGLPSNCVTGVIESSDGSFFISTYRGICRYAPDYGSPPLIRINEVDAGKIYKSPKNIELTEIVPSIRIKYHGVSFKTKRMRYNYILEGYDKDWKATWNEDVRYENLPIGEYKFKVIAINRDLVYSEEPAEISLKVVRDPREKVISELEEIVKERTKELKEAKDRLEELVEERTEELTLTVKRLQKEVTDRKRAESALRESERRYRFLYEEGTVISLVVGMDGIIRDVNKAFIKELGYSKNEVLGKNAIDLVIPEQREKINTQLEQDFKGVYTPEIDVGVYAKDGSIHTVLFSSGQAILYENNIPNSILITGIDITERKKAEELAKLQQQQLIQADKMATLGILVSGIAHEINNPNTFILLNARIFSKIWNGVIPILDKYYRENGDFVLAGMPYSQACERIGLLVSGISEGSQRIQRIVQGLKDYARLDPGNMNQRVNINSVVEASILIVNNLIKKSTEKFTCEYGSDLPNIRGNSQRLEQVIINLLTNACQALQDKGKGLSISTSYDKESDRVVAKVYDEGVGISPDDLKHITDPFFTTKRNSGGTGLGLSISHNIVNSHGGELNFISELGKGTTVVLTFPVQRESEVRS